MAERPVQQATYVFCLMRSARAPSVRGAPAGMPGAGRPRALRIDRGLWAIVADAPLDRFSPERLDEELRDLESVSRHAVAHAATIEYFFKHGPVIPLKLFTLFSEERRARQHLMRRKSRLRRLFTRLGGHEEWGVRITGATAGRETSAATTSVRTGRAYLERKKAQRDQRTIPSRTTRQDLSRTLNTLRRLAADTRSEQFPPPGDGRPYVVGASFLVKAGSRSRWRKQVARLAAGLEARGHRLDLSGPWPPYHFAMP
jgi:hypothetical protein